MSRFIGRRALHLLTVFIGISIFSFVLANIAPQDPAEAYVRRMTKAPTQEMIERYREEYGFDRSVPEQYMNWLKDVMVLDFGTSYLSGKPAMASILDYMPTTLALAGLTSLMVLLFGIPLGIWAAHKEGTWVDRLIMGFTFLSVSVPGYFLGLLFLLIFGIHLKIMPVVGHGHPVSTLCAAFILAYPMIYSLCRILRSLILENRSAPYIVYAKARGISRRKVMTGHLLRNAAPPCIVMFFQNFSYLIAGTAIVENIFSTKGMGQYILSAALNRDFPVITAYLLLMSLCFVLCNTLAEAVGVRLNPQLMREDGT